MNATVLLSFQYIRPVTAVGQIRTIVQAGTAVSKEKGKEGTYPASVAVSKGCRHFTSSYGEEEDYSHLRHFLSSCGHNLR
jgi:hypothetical protein